MQTDDCIVQIVESSRLPISVDDVSFDYDWIQSFCPILLSEQYRMQINNCIVRLYLFADEHYFQLLDTRFSLPIRYHVCESTDWEYILGKLEQLKVIRIAVSCPLNIANSTSQSLVLHGLVVIALMQVPKSVNIHWGPWSALRYYYRDIRCFKFVDEALLTSIADTLDSIRPGSLNSATGNATINAPSD